MTALERYERLEAAGVWRANAEAQRLNVYIALGDASLTITDIGNRPLGHWSLAAVERQNPGKRPAIYYPSGDPCQTLELGDEANALIDALEHLRTAIGRKRPHPGRLRLLITGGVLALVAALVTIWLPDATRDHVARVLPEIKRTEIAQLLRTRIEKVTGPACSFGEGPAALARLAAALPDATQPARIEIVTDGVRASLALPGGTVLVAQALIEDYDDPDILVGFVLAETLWATKHDLLGMLLDQATMLEAIQLLTTGEPSEDMLNRYAAAILSGPRPTLSDEEMLLAFRDAGVRTTPYAYAVDRTGETTLGLIEADPYAGASPPALLSDADWVRLQGICDG